MAQERRVFINLAATPALGSTVSGTRITLSPEDAHHLRDVLRLSPGNTVTAINAATRRRYTARVAEASRHAVVLELLDEAVSGERRSRVASLIFALTKGERTDLVCEKACELGVEHIILWQADRSIVRIEPGDRARKEARWARILESAARQSDRNEVPALHLALTRGELLKTLDTIAEAGDRFLTCSLAAGAVELRELPRPAGRVHLLVGPEGDLTPEEERTIMERHFELVSLGPLVLRSETAALAAVAMANGVWGFRPEQPS